MIHSSSEQEVSERFSKIYENVETDLRRTIERSVCGCDYGGSSWTNVDEARMISKMLALNSGQRILDIGAGSGWPSVFLAKESGCDIVLTDLHVSGLRVAADRAVTDQILGTCWAAVANGMHLPFCEGSFDRIIHNDVLCCLVEKRAALEACRQVVSASGKMIFTVISIAPELSSEDHKIAAESGPPFIDSDISYLDMLEQTGWEITNHQDLTADYHRGVDRMVEQLEIHADELSTLMGDDEASGERDRRRASLNALDAGLLKRELFGITPAPGYCGD